MASISLPKHCSICPTIWSPNKPIFPSSQLLPYNSQPKFNGLRFSNSFAAPRHLAFKPSIVAAKVNKGQVPPSFTLKDQDGKAVSLSKFKGKPVVLYFYPADESPSCTKQACAFRDSYEKFKKAGAEVVGISGDDSSSHKSFAKKYRLPFTLLSDEGNKVRKDWGVPSDLFGALPGRQTYVLDKKVFIISQSITTQISLSISSKYTHHRILDNGFCKSRQLFSDQISNSVGNARGRFTNGVVLSGNSGGKAAFGDKHPVVTEGTGAVVQIVAVRPRAQPRDWKMHIGWDERRRRGSPCSISSGAGGGASGG